MGEDLRRELLKAHFSSKNDFSLDSVKPGSPRAAFWVCDSGHEWKAAVRKVLKSGQRCPYCQNKRCLAGFNDLASQRPDLLPFYDYMKNPDPSTIQATHNKPLSWRCSEGHGWLERPFVVGRSTGELCPSCKTFKRSIEYRAAAMLPWLAKPEDRAVDASSRTPIALKCPAGHEFKESPGIFRKAVRCKFCEGTKVLSGFNDIKTLFPWLAAEWADEVPMETVSAQSSLRAKWKCPSCGYSWEAYVYNRTSGYGECFKCSAKSGSKPQRELSEFIESFGFRPQLNIRTVLASSKELDIYIPELKLAVEFNGVYWHSTLDRKKSTRHYDKWRECEAAGIRLFVVWSDDWKDRRLLVERLLKAELGVRDKSSISAHETVTKPLRSADAFSFLEANHIRGPASGKSYGLFHGDLLVAVLVARKSSSMPGYVTIVRYAAALSVPGGFMKILDFLEDRESPAGFMALSNNAFCEGSLYEASGFMRDRDLPPNYTYNVKGKRVHRLSYRKARFVEEPELKFVEGLSESRLAELNGLRRCFDYGQTRWVKRLPS